MIVLSENARIALNRAQRAYEATIEATTTRSINNAETRFYAAAEALFHVLSADQANSDH